MNGSVLIVGLKKPSLCLSLNNPGLLWGNLAGFSISQQFLQDDWIMRIICN